MKVILGGTEYDLESVGRLTLWDGMELKKQTGITLNEFMERASKFTGEESPTEYDDETLLMVGIMVWMARRRAGENLTLEQACDFPINELEIRPDEPPDPQPAIPPDGGQATEPASSPSPPT